MKLVAMVGVLLALGACGLGDEYERNKRLNFDTWLREVRMSPLKRRPKARKP